MRLDSTIGISQCASLLHVAPCSATGNIRNPHTISPEVNQCEDKPKMNLFCPVVIESRGCMLSARTAVLSVVYYARGLAIPRVLLLDALLHPRISYALLPFDSNVIWAFTSALRQRRCVRSRCGRFACDHSLEQGGPSAKGGLYR